VKRSPSRSPWYPRTALLVAAIASSASAQEARGGYEFAACGKPAVGSRAHTPIRSLYIPMRDGIRIALDVVLPDPLPSGAKIPAVLMMTRYYRSSPNAEPSAIIRSFASNGYAVVNGDVRGTGASFGLWPHHRTRDETLDYGEVMDWIVRQPWSNGQIVGWGLSYGANTVDWMVERNHPPFKAALSRFPDYDPYAHLYFPGGVPNAMFGRAWGTMVKGLDTTGNVRPVDEDPDGRTLALAIARRRDVPDVWQSLQGIVFRDDRPKPWGGWSMDDWGIHAWSKRVESSGTPLQSWGGWMDAGTADGVLRRFMTLRNPQRVFIGPWSHGGFHHASPYGPADEPTDPTVGQQRAEDLCTLERWLRPDGRRTSVPGKLLVYYTMGEERWKTTSEWPIPGTDRQRWYLRAGNGLRSETPAEPSGADRYTVDFDATTGTSNRWATQFGAGNVIHGDRAIEDKRLLVYTSEPITDDLEITGHPVVRLYLTSTETDGAFFVYLEDVAPDGKVYYVTEGMLRGIHRKVSTDRPPYRVLGPYHSFRRKDAMPLVPGEQAELSFELLPTSVLIRRGHRLRVAIAGADKDTFRRIPDQGTPVLSIERHRDRPSHIELPVVPRR